jgi:tripartite-type tricarboxylate transporter receptor subunit TctC
MAFDPVNAIAPVSLIGHSVHELIALAKSRRAMTYASSGNGTTLHLGGELFRLMAGAELVHVRTRATRRR